MIQRMEHEADGDGARVTSLASSGRTVEVPEEIDGVPVTSIGPRFLAGSQGVSGRTLRIPASVVRMDRDALEGATGLEAVEYGGEIGTFSGFGLTCPCDCRLVCGDGFSFDFKGGVPMGFPGFDKAMLAFGSGLTLETAVARLSRPVLLSDADLEGYRQFASERIVLRAERAVSSGDVGVLKELISTGMMGEGDLRRLLDRSARSGKVAATSTLMSAIMSQGSKGRRAPA
ncbi:MAG: hypothetical protein J5674_00065 [Candidatus Methanomethylophilaceae archaeon]|nr:hypothetical protein [Candidatus Methanomethylophilaceae archaeon]